MITLKFCPKCRKVFAIEVKMLDGVYCPNCYDGYIHNHDQAYPPEAYLKAIILQHINLEDLINK